MAARLLAPGEVLRGDSRSPTRAPLRSQVSAAAAAVWIANPQEPRLKKKKKGRKKGRGRAAVSLNVISFYCI